MLPFTGKALENAQIKDLNTIVSEDSSAMLLDATNRYLAFIQRISQGETFPQAEVAATILTPDCRKIFNGSLFTASRDAFVADLLEVNRTQGCWTVQPVDIIPAPQSNVVVVRLMITMDTHGAFTEILILRFNSDYLIQEMNVVFSKIEDSYKFDGGTK